MKAYGGGDQIEYSTFVSIEVIKYLDLHRQYYGFT